MKWVLPTLVCLVSLQAFSDDNQDAYNAGASFGKGNATQGTGSLSNTGTVTSTIPGYTSNPPQSSYYGGVQGGDGGIADKGQTNLQTNDAGQEVISSGTTNPPPTIDPNATFITTGKNAESSAGSIVDGTNSQCTSVSVSKSTFENYTCDKDVSSVEACTRTATPSGHMESSTVLKTITITNGDWNLSYDLNRTVYFSFTSPYTGPIINASLQLHFDDKLMNFVINFWGIDENPDPANDISWPLPQAAGYELIQGRESPVGSIYNDNCLPASASRCRDYAQKTYNWFKSPGTEAALTMTITVQAQESHWVPEVSWSESCPFNKSQGKATGSVCTVPGGNRTVTQNGQNYTVYSDCWQYEDDYTVPTSSAGTCSSLTSNPQCTVSKQTCSESTDGQCTHMTYTWQCQKTYSSGGLMCGGTYFCQSGSCDDANGAGDNGFDVAVSKLAGLASAGDDVAANQDAVNVTAFTGEDMSCRKAAAGFSNCCKDSGWGSDVGLSKCNSDELALGKAKAKKVTVSVGERCDHAVIGVCLQKSQVYCVFQGKLARIIQEQGRRDQLGVSFGSGDNPSCRGITVPELQKIDFDKINFSDFYEDLMNNQKVPNTDVMVKQVKDRIAAQVQQQQKSGG
ncbi:type-F conjugative transfer system mating-pair stabilization protein TraN [Scandinavium sp. NPDC088450]|uniref:type-F conjugative transfer system mating-pair stabilization protein TraN n=1 Tax=Scandinavium sp. NPDC088450 TaxID=3364514 RepID=UPI00384BB729